MSLVIAPWRPKPKPVISAAKKATSCVCPNNHHPGPLIHFLVFSLSCSPGTVPKQQLPAVVVAVVAATLAEVEVEARGPSAIDAVKLDILLVRAPRLPETQADTAADIAGAAEEEGEEGEEEDSTNRRLGNEKIHTIGRTKTEN